MLFHILFFNRKFGNILRVEIEIETEMIELETGVRERLFE